MILKSSIAAWDESFCRRWNLSLRVSSSLRVASETGEEGISIFIKLCFGESSD